MMKKKFLAMVFVILTVSLVALSGCGNYGTFYFLTEAYELGLITQEDLLSIAYYHNRGTRMNETLMGEDYEPIPQEPLDEKVEWRIKETVAEKWRKKAKEKLKSKEEMNELVRATYEDQLKASVDDVTIKKYYGTYGECIAVMMTDKYSLYSDAFHGDIVGGVSISYSNGNQIQVWRENK